MALHFKVRQKVMLIYSDPARMDLLYSAEQSVHNTYEIELDKKRWAQFLEITKLLPEAESKMLHLLLVERKTQDEISQLVGTTQATVAYHLRRAVNRCKWHAEHPVPQVNEEEIKKVLSAEQIEWAACYAEMKNQSHCGKVYGVSQAAFRARMTSIQTRLRKVPALVGYADYLDAIRASYPAMWDSKKKMVGFQRGFETVAASDMVESKQCSVCQKVQDGKEFRKGHSRCRQCQAHYMKDYYQKKKATLNASQKDRRARWRQRVAAYSWIKVHYPDIADQAEDACSSL